MSPYQIRLLKPDEYQAWDCLVATAQTGSIFNSTAWLNAVARLFNRELRIWGVYRNEELVAGTGLVSFKLLSFIKVAGFLPITPYNSIIIQPRDSDKEARCASYRLAVLELLARVLATEADVVDIINHPALTDIRPFSWLGWSSKIRYTYLIDISKPGQLWEQTYEAFRRQVRKCEREKIELECNADSKTLYQLYHGTYEKQGRRIYVDESSFCGLCEVLKAEARLAIYIARREGQAISGLGIVKDYRGVIHEWVAGTNPEYLKLGVASFMLWTVIEQLAREGFTCFDLNGANVPAIARHKSQLGGRLTPYYEIRTQTARAKLFEWGQQKAQVVGGLDWLKQKLLNPGRI
ncbi:MAG: GNAT family N-acetyltransferase [Anaerolineae bacterium]|nr:GNAT family N-acetyltransferase [Anaerolineae bacterium]